jgi:nucleotide-binding universal stress UspA family protein
MRTIVAAIDGGLATKPVLACARAMGDVLHAHVVAVHVRTGGVAAPRAFTQRAGVPLRVLHGRVDDRLIEAGSTGDVVAMVIGARGLVADPCALGSTAAAVATRLTRPVVVVAPDAEVRTGFKRVLVPLAGEGPSVMPTALIELAPRHAMDVVVLHVIGSDSIPSFVDQPQHWHTAWTREFLARYCPWGIDEVEVEVRIGRRERLIADTARESGCDLIAMSWSQDLTEGRAQVVRATLRQSNLPVVLIPAPREEPPTGASADLMATVRQ